MSFLSGLFGTTKTTTPTTTVPIIDPVQKANYDSSAAQQEAIRKAAAGLPPSQVAGLDPMELQAYADTGTAVKAANATTQANAGLIDPSSQYQMKTITGPTASVVDPTAAAYDLAGNMNPYTDAVVSTTMADMERQAQRDQLARDAQASKVGGLSNTRAAVGDAVAQNLSQMSMAQIEAQLRSGAFDSATKTALDRQNADNAESLALANFGLDKGSTEANFGLAQEQALADNSNTQFDNSLAATSTLENLNQDAYLRSLGLAGVEGSLGETQRGLTQAEMNIPRTDLTYQAGINNAVNPGAMPTGTTSTTTTTNPSLFNQLLGAAASGVGAGLASSDRRVKDDVEDVDSALDQIARLSAKTYSYKPGYGHRTDRTSGLMAQDVEKSGIVGGTIDIGGVKHVDSYAVLATVVQAVNELRHMQEAGAGL